MDIKLTLFLQIHGGEYQNTPFLGKCKFTDFLKKTFYSPIFVQLCVWSSVCGGAGILPGSDTIVEGWLHI